MKKLKTVIEEVIMPALAVKTRLWE